MLDKLHLQELRYRRNVTPFGAVPSFHDDVEEVPDAIIKQSGQYLKNFLLVIKTCIIHIIDYFVVLALFKIELHS